MEHSFWERFKERFKQLPTYIGPSTKGTEVTHYDYHMTKHNKKATNSLKATAKPLKATPKINQNQTTQTPTATLEKQVQKHFSSPKNFPTKQPLLLPRPKPSLGAPSIAGQHHLGGELPDHAHRPGRAFLEGNLGPQGVAVYRRFHQGGDRKRPLFGPWRKGGKDGEVRF